MKKDKYIKNNEGKIYILKNNMYCICRHYIYRQCLIVKIKAVYTYKHTNINILYKIYQDLVKMYKI